MFKKLFKKNSKKNQKKLKYLKKRENLIQKNNKKKLFILKKLFFKINNLKESIFLEQKIKKLNKFANFNARIKNLSNLKINIFNLNIFDLKLENKIAIFDRLLILINYFKKFNFKNYN